MAALQILAIPTGIAAVCALPWPEIPHFHFVQLFPGQDTNRRCWTMARAQAVSLPTAAAAAARCGPARLRGALAALALGLVAPAAGAAELGPELERALARRASHADIAVIIRFHAPSAPAGATPGPRDSAWAAVLRRQQAASRLALQPVLAQPGVARVRELWIINGLALTLPAHAVRPLAAMPGIARIDLDSHVQGGPAQRSPAARGQGGAPAPAVLLPDDVPDHAPAGPATAARASVAPQWNIAALQAPALWAQGQSGQGVVVASMDTGVDLSHPALRRRWRGGSNSWFDPHGEEATPYDALGHGTQAMGIVLAGGGLGMAPDARWIAVRLFDSAGHARMSDIHLAFQWLLDPDGDPATADAPAIVNASWALSGGGAGRCILEFSEDILALRQAGIAVVFAAGNDGPAPGTSSSPGNNPGALSVGAVSRGLELERQSSRGPSACDGAAFPRLVAPGVNVRTTDLSHGGLPSYTVVSGSSLAAPHVAGALALLAGAFPSASVAELEAALEAGARRLPAGAARWAGAPGLPDALAAFDLLHQTHRVARHGARPDSAAAQLTATAAWPVRAPAPTRREP